MVLRYTHPCIILHLQIPVIHFEPLLEEKKRGLVVAIGANKLLGVLVVDQLSF